CASATAYSGSRMRETLPSAVGYKNACSMPWSSNSRSQSCALGALGNVRGSGGKVCWRARSQSSDAVSSPPRLLNGDFAYFRNSSVGSMLTSSASITFDSGIAYLQKNSECLAQRREGAKYE